MGRSRLSLETIAEWGNLAAAAHRAGVGKRYRGDAAAFLDCLDTNLAEMRAGILDGTVVVGEMASFSIRDPKPRQIHAPSFRERVLHHAIMAHAGPVLDRILVADTFACRTGKGSLAAVQRSREHVRRFGWFAKMDVRGYFASIDHGILKRQLAKRFENRRLLALFGRIIDAHQSAPGRGLPIGSLMSQTFANAYLNPLDRFLLETRRVRGLVRYMDDFLVWDDSREAIRGHVHAVEEFLTSELGLTLKPGTVINRSSHGVTVCGYRVRPGSIRLGPSRKRRFREARQRWESLYKAGRIDAATLQRGMDSVLAITAHADCTAWRRRQFQGSGTGTAVDDL